MAWPMPSAEPAPVISATRPSSRNGLVVRGSGRNGRPGSPGGTTPSYPERVQADAAAAALGAPVASIAELLDRMAAIDRALPAADGVGCFNRMYRLVIESVQAHVVDGFFGDPVWMGRLDLVFANLYLKALPGPEAAEPPRAWAPLVDSRSDQRSEEHTSELQSQSNLVCR